jgi:phage gpG-like protein
MGRWLVVKVRSVPKISASLLRAAKMLGDTKPLLEAIGERVAYRFRMNIKDSVTADGMPFKSLSRKRSQGGRGGKQHNPSMRPLVDFGTLFNSIDYDNTSKKDWVAIGSNVEYAGWQNKGTRNRHIPARKFMSHNTGDVSPEIRRFMKAAFDNSGGIEFVVRGN